jgi:hypothetical protein
MLALGKDRGCNPRYLFIGQRAIGTENYRITETANECHDCLLEEWLMKERL